MSKKPSFMHLEDCIRQIQMKKNVEGNLKTIQKILQREFGDIEGSNREPYKFQVSIIENNTGKLFGASVYPGEDTMRKMVTMLTEERPTSEVLGEVWRTSEWWIIELDSILLYDRSLKASAGEIVAVILHELGHVAFSNSVPERLNRVFRTYTMIQSIKIKSVLQSNVITKKILYFPIMAACATTNFKVGNTNKEIIADDYAYRCGYGEDLLSFIDKLLIAKGNSLINNTEKELDDEVLVFMNWSVENLSELSVRKNKLKHTLKVEKLRNPSKYVAHIISGIKETMFGHDKEDLYKQVVQESYSLTSVAKAKNTEPLRLFDKYKKVKAVKYKDLDIYAAEMARVESVDDKICLLENLYDELDKANLALDLLSKGHVDRVSQSATTIQNYRTEVLKLIEKVKAIEIQKERFGLYVKYPEGYEG